ncbi:ATP phosphoribosyltransferase regulatory subunit [uncultured Ruminococcus sp.]|uniref:ATP phosphoribosyltransferase regulatory subunit n=1 Tax=Massiliimalia timonensis TaxID=1987501 RepID=A0A8J6TU03_9FIRM|nr:ATP phosphoribosyltransferase regulatory subunit [Massiliimalia timonensis]MBC8610258.1 ATP phosphoribosyltransferase regulatory subunit [Massiliimalia timonensis]SCH01859.1 ATP phosphoribosyltransferase regulatory subunit [uncultured Ruminococcus sp.]SCH72331.1 ATP phosphoribosyltransferase regulatory subunit [uncultured Clostridium sp.]
MDKNKLITPEGTKDYLFEEAVLRRQIETALKTSFELRGYHEVVTPSLEFLDVFTAMENSIPVEQMYKLVDAKGRLMVLRPDSTMPIARLGVTRLKNEMLPLRLYYNQSVFSVNKSLRGRSDEIMQTGIELIGPSNQKADLEVLSTAMRALQELKIENFRMEIGHIGIFNALISSLAVEEEKKELIRQLIQSKNYPALQDMLDELEDTEEVSLLRQLPRFFGGAEVFTQMEMMVTDPVILGLLAYLKELYQLLSQMGMQEHITVDLGIVNRTDYYTGIVFKGYVEGYGEEVLSGGRYDGLFRAFGEDWGAVGFGVNVDSAVNALLSVQEHKILPISVLVYSEAGYQTAAFAHIQELAAQGISSEYSLSDTREEALLYAKQKAIGRVDIISESVDVLYCGKGE